MQRTLAVLAVLVVALTALPAVVSAQTATRRSTSLASLAAYPGFYHGRPILIVGKVALGRMKPDDPQLANYDLKRTFNIDQTGSWPRPGEVTAIIATSVTRAQLPPNASIRSIALHPTRFLD